MNTARTIVAFTFALLALLLTAPVLLLGLPFWGVAGLTRAFVRLLAPPSMSWRELIDYDPVVGWKPRPNLDTYSGAEHDDVFHTVTDAEGWPGKLDLAESAMVVFGDSFAFGFGIDAERSYFEFLPHLRIKAIASPGYNLVQQLLLMEDMAPRLQGKLIVWFVYVGNDLYDNLAPLMGGYRTPFVREARDGTGWEIVSSHLTPRRWPYSTGRHRMGDRVMAALHSPTFLADRAYAACDFIIQRAREACASAGARLVVFTIPTPLSLSPAGLVYLAKFSENPHSVDADFPDKKISEICRRHDVPCIVGKRFLRVHDYKSHDDHWNERGHKRVAQVLSRLDRAYADGMSQGVDLVTSFPLDLH